MSIGQAQVAPLSPTGEIRQIIMNNNTLLSQLQSIHEGILEVRNRVIGIAPELAQEVPNGIEAGTDLGELRCTLANIQNVVDSLGSTLQDFYKL